MATPRAHGGGDGVVGDKEQDKGNGNGGQGGDGKHDKGGGDQGNGDGKDKGQDGNNGKGSGQEGNGVAGGAFIVVPFALLSSVLGGSLPVRPRRRRPEWLRRSGRGR